MERMEYNMEYMECRECMECMECMEYMYIYIFVDCMEFNLWYITLLWNVSYAYLCIYIYIYIHIYMGYSCG